MNIAIYGSHDGSVCLKHNGEYRIFEAERFFRRRYSTISQVWGHLNTPRDQEYLEFFQYIKQFVKEPVKTCYYNQLFKCDFDKIRSIFPVENFQFVDHHYAHACGAFYQSKFEESIVVTYDGGGENLDGTNSFFVVWIGNKDGVIKHTEFSLNLGTPYQNSAIPIKCIKKYNAGLSNSGKLMGLCAFGNVVLDWIVPMEKYYTSGNLTELGKSIRLDLKEDALDGQIAYDFAATSQYVFESIFRSHFLKLNLPNTKNICFAGGCALNIEVNQRFVDMGYNVYVPANPNDCGLSVGMMLAETKDRIDTLYSGFEILDEEFDLSYFKSIPVTATDIAKLLYIDKKIIGLIDGNSECGPRALGHRSILCYPDISDLKETLNQKIKFREWFRPFGCIVKLNDLSKYFKNAIESKYMSFCPSLKNDYIIPSIAHVNLTSRVQTITGHENSLLFSIITHIEFLGGKGILLNTSFNMKGSPILTRLEDAATILQLTKLDGFIYKYRYYSLLKS